MNIDYLSDYTQALVVNAAMEQFNTGQPDGDAYITTLQQWSIIYEKTQLAYYGRKIALLHRMMAGDGDLKEMIIEMAAY